MKPISTLFLTTLLAAAMLPACLSTPRQPAPNDSGQSSTINTSSTTGDLNIKAEVWADNWFAFSLGNQLVLEDSVPITTERSFNAETFMFKASYPLSLNFILKDFKENDTGLEYIGTNKQQMGDGGFIAQFTNTDTGEIIAVTNSNWVCTVIHEAPLDKACEKESNPVSGQGACGFSTLEEPPGWKEITFNDSSWMHATEYTEAQVSPKDGYDEISWDSSAKLIWGPDLETNNTLLCRLTITGQ